MRPAARPHALDIAMGRWLRPLVQALGLAFVGWFAVEYAAERLYADAAYFLMHVVDESGFHVINGRWIIVLTQWLPVLGVKLGLPMSTLIVLFSLGNVVLLASSLLFVGRYLGDRNAGPLLIGVQVIGLAQALFCPIFEFYYGAMLLVVFHALLRSDRPAPWIRLPLLSLLFVGVISSHFMGLVVMLLMLTLDRIWERGRLWIGLLVLLVAHLVQRTYFLSAYESNAFSSVLLRMDVIGIQWILAPGRLWSVLLHVVRHYPDTLALGLFASGVLVRKADRWGLLLLGAGTALIYCATSLYLPDTTHSYYREIVDYPGTVWILLVIGARTLDVPRTRTIFLVVLGLSIVFRMHRVLNVAATYRARTTFIEERIEAARTQGIERGLVQEGPNFRPAGGRTALLPIMSPTEALLLSARQGPDHVVVLVPFAGHTPDRVTSTRLDQSMAQFGMEFPTGHAGPYFHMPTADYVVLE